MASHRLFADSALMSFYNSTDVILLPENSVLESSVAS